MPDAATPPRLSFTAAEQRVINRLRSPLAIGVGSLVRHITCTPVVTKPAPPENPKPPEEPKSKPKPPGHDKGHDQGYDG